LKNLDNTQQKNTVYASCESDDNYLTTSTIFFNLATGIVIVAENQSGNYHLSGWCNQTPEKKSNEDECHKFTETI
jgi:hypothetical protein